MIYYKKQRMGEDKKRTAAEVNSKIRERTDQIAQALSAYEHIRVHLEKGKSVMYGGKTWEKKDLRTIMAGIKHAVDKLPVEVKDWTKSTRKGELSPQEVSDKISEHLGSIQRAVQKYFPDNSQQLTDNAIKRYNAELSKRQKSGRGPKEVQALTYLSDQLVSWLKFSFYGKTDVQNAVKDIVFDNHISAPSLTMSLTSLANNLNSLHNGNRIRTDFEGTQTFFGANSNTVYTINGNQYPTDKLIEAAKMMPKSKRDKLMIKLANQNLSGLDRLAMSKPISTRRSTKNPEKNRSEPAITTAGYLGAANMILTGYYTLPRDLLGVMGLPSADTPDNKEHILALQEFISWYNNASKSQSPRSARSPRTSSSPRSSGQGVVF